MHRGPKRNLSAVMHIYYIIYISKLEYVGITGNILKWIEDFLRERKQRVKVGRYFSSSAKVLSGIPQGSILGPILFTIFINDLPNWVSSCCKIFADDTKLYDVAIVIMYRSKLTSMLCKGGRINGTYILIQTRS